MKKLLFYIPLLLVFMLGNINSFGQHKTIKGSVKFTQSGKPALKTKVKLSCCDENEKTDKNGNFSIDIPDTCKSWDFDEFADMKIDTIIISSPDFYEIYLSPLTEEDILSLSFEELKNLKVVTASKNTEKMSEAPASMIVISKDEIAQRGYNNLVEIFQDLPGIDLSLAYADTYYKAYWRGFRTGMADSWLFMIDGRVMNHLWYNFNNIMIATPLSNIERIEVVYGPASAVYGANAMTGVINVITKNNASTDGVSTNVKLAGGSFENRLLDMNIFYKTGDIRFSTTLYYSHGDLDKKSLENFEWTNPKYLKDRKLWGAFLDNSVLAGEASAPQNNRAIGFSLMYKEYEIGLNYKANDNSYGINYPFDKMQISPKWIEPDIDFYINYSHKFTNKFMTSGMARIRNCNVSNESTSVETSGNYGEPQLVAFGYWQSLNRSYSVFQDFDILPTDFLTFKTGIRYELKNLQKAYDLPYGLWLSPDSITSLSIPGLFPEPPEDVFLNEKHEIWIEEGAYLQGKFNIGNLLNTESSHILNAGVRYDNSSYYGESTTFRVGYVGKFGHFQTKFLYGEAFKEPAARQLYGGWAAIASNPNLKPETSQTIETVFSYTLPMIDISINPYFNKMKNMIMEINKVSINHGNMQTMGADVIMQKEIKVPVLSQFKLWGSYSYIITEEEKYKITDPVNMILEANGTGEIGDMSTHKVHFGANLHYKDISLMLRGRFIGDKKTVDSNPLGKVDAYTTFDMHLLIENVFCKGFNISLKINNLTNTQYFHAGIRKADSGNTPGYWVGDKWYGSKGFYNSLLPQPGRYVQLGIQLKL